MCPKIKNLVLIFIKLLEIQISMFYFSCSTVANQMSCVSVARHHYTKGDLRLDILMSGRLVLFRRKRII